MITKTSLFAEGYLLRVKAAVGRAIRKAHRHSNVQGVGHADVYSRKGRYSLMIVARKGGKWEAFDGEDNDVTATVLAALQIYHLEKRLDKIISGRHAEMTCTGRSRDLIEQQYIRHVVESTQRHLSKPLRHAENVGHGSAGFLAAFGSDLYAPSRAYGGDE